MQEIKLKEKKEKVNKMASDTYQILLTQNWQLLTQNANTVSIQNLSGTGNAQIALCASGAPTTYGKGFLLYPNAIFPTISMVTGDALYVKGDQNGITITASGDVGTILLGTIL